MFFCFTRQRYQVSVYRTNGPLVLECIEKLRTTFEEEKTPIDDNNQTFSVLF